MPDPFIDFTKLENPPEGIDPAVLNSEAVQNYVKSAFDNNYETRFENDVSGLKSNVETIKSEKQKLQEHLDKYKGIDLDQYNQLVEFKKSNGDASKLLDAANEKNQVLQAERDGVEDVYKEKMSAIELERNQVAAQLNNERLTNQVMQGVREHNGKFPSVAVIEGNERWINEEASKVWKFNAETGKFTPMNGDRVLTSSASGEVMTYPEWVNSLRDRAEFKSMFHQPQGGGAGGGGGGGQHYNPKNLAGNADERRSAIGGMFPDLPAK